MPPPDYVKFIHLKYISDAHAINLKWLIEFYQENKKNSPDQEFFNKFFVKLAGTTKLQKQIEAGFNEEEIRETWQIGIQSFKKIRAKYLIYN